MPRPVKMVLWAVLAVLWALPFLPRLLRKLGNETPLVDHLSWVAYTGLGFFVLAFTLLVLVDLLRWVLPFSMKVLRPVLAGFNGKGGIEPPIDHGRRRLLAYPVNLALVGVSGALAGYGFAEAVQLPQVVRVRVRLPSLPPQFEGFQIAQLSDVHVGPMIKQKFMGDVVDLTNALEPDLIAITGDLVDGSVGHLTNAVSPLSALSAHHGSYFVTGNHEYYSGAEPWLEKIDRLGLRVLLNDHKILQRGNARMLVAGVTDPYGGRFVNGHAPDLAAAVSGSGPVDVKLLLAHQPRAIDSAASAGFDLQLSGHTHGGQFIPWTFLVDLTQPYLKGLHKHQNTWIYVNSGTGFLGPPMRLGTHPEITLIELTAGKEPEKA